MVPKIRTREMVNVNRYLLRFLRHRRGRGEGRHRQQRHKQRRKQHPASVHVHPSFPRRPYQRTQKGRALLSSKAACAPGLFFSRAYLKTGRPIPCLLACLLACCKNLASAVIPVKPPVPVYRMVLPQSGRQVKGIWRGGKTCFSPISAIAPQASPRPGPRPGWRSSRAGFRPGG